MSFEFLQRFKRDFLTGVDAQDRINISKDKYRYTIFDPEVTKSARQGYEGVELQILFLKQPVRYIKKVIRYR